MKTLLKCFEFRTLTKSGVFSQCCNSIRISFTSSTAALMIGFLRLQIAAFSPPIREGERSYREICPTARWPGVTEEISRAT